MRYLYTNIKSKWTDLQSDEALLSRFEIEGSEGIELREKKNRKRYVYEEESLSDEVGIICLDSKFSVLPRHWMLFLDCSGFLEDVCLFSIFFFKIYIYW